jgi:uncharacterized RDD family membrane protein YckC
MKTTPLFLLTALALTSLLGAAAPASATAPPSASDAAPAAAAPATAAQPSKTLKIEIKAGSDADQKADAPADADKDGDADTNGDASADRHEGGGSHDNALVSIGHDSNLASDGHVTAVVSVLGSSTSAGQVDESVVSVLGDTRVTGPVGENAVAVLGSTYIDSRVGQQVVAVFGNVELGPHADVGDVVAVGGEFKRDPAAIVRGNVQNVALFGHMGGFEWLRSWVHHCLMYGRPLAFAPGLGWAWTIALSFLALYLLIALLFPRGVNQCVRTMETQPGRTVVASLLAFLAKPIVFVLLVAIVVGTILIPFLALALFFAGLFGKAVALAWLGRRALPAGEAESEPRPVLAVLVGGAIALVLYVIPVIGFVSYKALDVLGFGIVVYTLLLGLRAARAAGSAGRPVPPAGTPSAGTSAPSAVPPSAPADHAPPPAASQSEAFTAAETASTQSADAHGTAAAAAAHSAPPPAASASAATPAPVSLELENRAGFWIRMAALLLDLILVAIVLTTINVSHHTFLLIVASYGAVMWKLKGTTIGGVVCGLRVVRLDGRAIDWPTAVARALGCFLSAAVAGLGFIWVVFDAERQSWHDKIAGTVVVHAPRGTPLV